MSIRLRVLNVVINSPCPIDANEIAEKAFCPPSSAHQYLTTLYREELVNRKKSERGRFFVYFPREGVKSVWDGGKYEVDLPGDKLVDAAIEANRGRRRVGERFTREEVERFREEHRGRRRHGVIRT